MIEVLQPGDMILQFKGNIISEKLDLSELKENNPKEYNISFKITGNTTEEIQAYIKLLNKNEPQNYLANKKLNVDINTSELKCEIFVPEPTMVTLRKNDSQKYLSEDIQGEMYRYQATSPERGASLDVSNYICFGTTNKEECTNEETGIDKYMYRIIGITEEGQLYLLKNNPLKENDKMEFYWNSKFSFPDCLGEACEWPNVDLFKRINGISNGTSKGYNGNTNLFLGTSEHPSPYEYLTEGTEWYKLIADHNWMYGDTNEIDTYNADEMYAIETGKVATKRIWPDERQETCSSSSQCTEKEYTWSKSTKAKIGLMYIHDYLYAYTGGGTEYKNGGIEENWISQELTGHNLFMSRFGLENSGNELYYDTLFVAMTIEMRHNASVGSFVVPVFYLSSDVKIASGDGTKANPYILDVQEA